MAINLSCFSMVCAIFIVSSPASHATLLSNIFGFLQKIKSATDNDPKTFASKMCWKIYTGCGTNCGFQNTLDVPVEEPQALYDNINKKKPLVLYFHGYLEHPLNESVQTVVGAYLERGTDNIVVLDWSKLASLNYLTLAAARLPTIAKILAGDVDRIVELGVNVKKIHLVSHSLGSQLAGFVGKYSKYSIPRITALDPANPGFYHRGAEHINENSAKFVDVIHTDGGLYGASLPCGTVDFFANTGSRPQPGCSAGGVPFSSDDLCSHHRSWRFYAESILNEQAFTAFYCSSSKKFFLGECGSNRSVYVGYGVSTDVKGSFYFKTNAESPYSPNSRTASRNPQKT